MDPSQLQHLTSLLEAMARQNHYLTTNYRKPEEIGLTLCWAIRGEWAPDWALVYEFVADMPMAAMLDVASRYGMVDKAKLRGRWQYRLKEPDAIVEASFWAEAGVLYGE